MRKTALLVVDAHVPIPSVDLSVSVMGWTFSIQPLAGEAGGARTTYIRYYSYIRVVVAQGSRRARLSHPWLARLVGTVSDGVYSVIPYAYATCTQYLTALPARPCTMEGFLQVPIASAVAGAKHAPTQAATAATQVPYLLLEYVAVIALQDIAMVAFGGRAEELACNSIAVSRPVWTVGHGA